MSARSILAIFLVTASALPAASALAQRTPAPVPAPARDPLAPVPAARTAAQPATATPSETAPAPAQPAPPAELPPPAWQPASAQELLTYIRAIAVEGLDPRDYAPDRLDNAIRSGNAQLLAQVASDSFKKVASDLALGHVRGANRQQWFVVDKDLEGERLNQLLAQAASGGRVTEILRSLLPTHPQYGALRNSLALARSGDSASTDKIRLNMDRWRWLPRDLGDRYIIVNVPGIHATLVENGVTRWKHRAIAGATKTPTPQLSALATGVILNPWWEVPRSLNGEVAGKRGYLAVKGKDGKVQRWRQPPGGGNALGKIKFVMPNPHAIYLHDTNARGLFDAKARFLSHGCIRTEHILDLATELLSDDGGAYDRARVDQILASGKTVQANFVKPVPVYIVYFSTAALTDGSLVQYNDLYKRDGKVITALNDHGAPAAKTAKTAAKD